MRAARDRDLRQVAAAVARELGGGWFPAQRPGAPEAGFLAHADGREIRLSQSGRNRERLAAQGTARAGERLLMVGRPVTVALGSSPEVIARHIERRLLPSYVELFHPELERARRLDAEEAEQARVAAGLQGLGGSPDPVSPGGLVTVWLRGPGGGGKALVWPGGDTELHLRVSGPEALEVMALLDGRESRPSPAGPGRGREVAVEAPGARRAFTVRGDETLTVLVDGEPLLGVDRDGPVLWSEEGEWRRLPPPGPGPELGG